MAVFRVEKTKDYTVMSNYHLRDMNLSLKAKGLLSWMLSNNDEWDYSVAGIVANVKESRDAVNSALTELEDYGYLTRRQIRAGGKFGDMEYLITEKPITENPLTVNPITENPKQRNTNINNNQTKKNSLSKDKESKAPSKAEVISEVYKDPSNAYIVEALRKYHNWFRDNHYGFHASTFVKWAELLRKEAKDNPDRAMAIVDQSITKGWKSLYPLKSDVSLVGKYQKKEADLALDENGNPIVF